MKSRSIFFAFPVVALAWAACGAPAAESKADPHLTHSPSEETEPGIVQLDLEAIRLSGIHLEPALLMEFDNPLVATAVVAPNASRVAHVRPLSQGIVEQIWVAKGDRVRQGQLLVRYDNVELGDLINRSRSQAAQVRAAQTDEDLRRKLLRQGEALFEAEAISRMELDVRTAAHRKAQDSVMAAQAELARTNERLRRYGVSPQELQRLETEPPGQTVSRTELRAPFSGTVIEFDVGPGEVVTTQQTLLTIADLSSVWVLADIYEKDLGKIKLGQPVRIRSEAFPDDSFPGRLTSIGDLVDQRTRTVKVRCEVPNPDYRLKLDMFLRAEISTGKRQKWVAVPEQAVQTMLGSSFVFVQLQPGRFQQRRVEVSFRRGGLAAIASGLQPGEQAVTEGAFALKSHLLGGELEGHEH